MRFEKISQEDRKKLEKVLYKTIVEAFRTEKIKENYYKYSVKLQDIIFVTDMTDDELKESINIACDVMEELKKINNEGMDKKKLKEIQDKEYTDELFETLDIWNAIATEHLKELLNRADVVQRVAGVWAAIIANPVVISAITIVYEIQVDKFDDEELYAQGAYFVTRAIMKMRGTEIQRKENSKMKSVFNKSEYGRLRCG